MAPARATTRFDVGTLVRASLAILVTLAGSSKIEKELVNAGSSMEKVLKVSVFLAKAEDYAPMNEVFLGRFGENPPVRTTVAAAQAGYAPAVIFPKHKEST